MASRVPGCNGSGTLIQPAARARGSAKTLACAAGWVNRQAALYDKVANRVSPTGDVPSHPPRQ